MLLQGFWFLNSKLKRLIVMQRNKNTVVFVKKIKPPLPAGSKRDLQRFLRMYFFKFCDHVGMENTIDTYRGYRALCRDIYEVDLATARPRKEVCPIEMQLGLFPTFPNDKINLTG